MEIWSGDIHGRCMRPPSIPPVHPSSCRSEFAKKTEEIRERRTCLKLWVRGSRGMTLPNAGEIIESSGGPRHLSTIPLKNFNLFKIAESVFNFCLKNFSN